MQIRIGGLAERNPPYRGQKNQAVRLWNGRLPRCLIRQRRFIADITGPL
jgi:hypothetical protein